MRSFTQPCLNMMDMNQTFQQRWDFRRKDDEIDSTSDDSKSSSSEPAGKKHKLVLVLSSPEKDEATDLTQISQQKSQVNPTRGSHFQIAKANKQSESGKKRNAAGKKSKRNCGEKSKRVTHSTLDQDPAPLGDFKNFTDSLLEEIKVAREKMFAQMRKRIAKLVTAKPVSEPRRNREPNSRMAVHQSGNKSGRKTQTCYEGLPKGKRRSNGKLNAAVDEGEARSLAIKKSLHFPNDSDQLGSWYLTLPTVLPQPQTERLSSNVSLCDHIHCGISGRNANHADKEKSLADASNHYNYLLGIQPAEQLGSFEHITSKDMIFMNQQSSQTSSILSVLPVPLHQWSNDGFKPRSQGVVVNPAEEDNRMNNGAMGFAGRSHTLPECFDGSSSVSHKYNSDGGRYVSFSSGDSK